jgi:tRNA threonylcarbamoyl adenosine modification protein YeaZ
MKAQKCCKKVYYLLMKGLILETSTNQPRLILTEEKVPIKSLSLPEGPGLSQTLGISVAELLEGDRCDFVAVGQGPGSYTGIRVGAAMAQALAYAWNVPLFSFCSMRAFLPRTIKPCAVLFDARIAGFYCLKSDELQPCVINLHRAAEELVQLPLFSPHPELIRKRLDIPVQPVSIDLQHLSTLCCERAFSHGRPALEPIPFVYTPST